MAILSITDGVAIPEEELVFQTSRSSGPGGQHVNKVESRVTLLFDVEASPSLSEEARRRLRQALPTRISRRGVLRVSSQRHRSQAANRAAATERFVALLREVLEEDPERRPTRIPPSVHRRRLEGKRRRGELKRGRGPVRPEE